LDPEVDPGANPTSASYNASVVKEYNTTSRLLRFENQNIYFNQYILENALAHYNAGVAPVYSKVLGLVYTNSKNVFIFASVKRDS
jgi:hypothetical protein